MNTSDFTGIRIKKADWLALPAAFRKMEGGAMMILSAGVFRPVLIVGR